MDKEKEVIKKRYSFDGKCPQCDSKNVEYEEVPNSGRWAYNYQCNECETLFSVTYEDRMGSQLGDIVQINHQHDPIPDKPDPEQQEDMTVKSVSGVFVMVILSDGSIRQAQVKEFQHMRTILNVCTLNERKGLILGSQDFGEILKPYINIQNLED